MDSKNLKRNIVVFCLYRFVSRFYLYLSILAIILYNYKLSFIKISLVLAAHGISIMVFKAPIGKISKKVTSGRLIIFTGELIKALGVLLLAISKGNIGILVVAQVISGIGFALTSGTESGLLLKAMKAGNAADKYRKIEAKSQGFGFISILISGVIGSIIAKTDNTLALYLTAPFSALASVIILFFKEPIVENASNNAAGNSNSYVDKESVKASISSVLELLLFYAVNRAIIMAIFVFLLPMFLLKSFSIDLAFFGAILGLFSLTANIIGTNFEKVSNMFKKNQLWIIVPAALFCAVLVLSLQNKYLLLIVPVLLGIAASIVRPLAIGKVNSIIKENNALVMSRGEQFFGLFNSIFLVIIGVLFTYVKIDNILYIIMGILLLVNIILAILFRNAKSKANNVAVFNKDIQKDMNS